MILESVQELFGRTMEELTGGAWVKFLETSAWTFKYSFPDQLLIYAQRPDATACATIELWNKRFGRTVKPNTAHIALIDDRGDEIKLNYVVDVADTEGPGEIPLWRLTARNKEYVYTALAAAYDVAALRARESSTHFFERVARAAVEQQMPQASVSLQRIKNSVEGLHHMSAEDAEHMLRDLLVASVSETMMRRCNLVPEPSQDRINAFSNIAFFRDPRALSILGQTNQASSRDALLVAAKAARDYDRTHKEELTYEQAVSQGRGLQDPGINNAADRTAEPVRQTAQDLPAGGVPERVHGNDSDRTAAGAPAGGRGEGTDPVRGTSEGTPEHEPGAGQEREHGSLDGAHDSAAAEGGRTSSDGAGVRLTEENESDAAEHGIDVSMPSVAEQAAVVASVTAIAVPQEEIDLVLTSDFSQKLNVSAVRAFFLEDPDTSAAVNFLKEQYDGLAENLLLPDGNFITVEALESGLFLKTEDIRGEIDWNSIDWASAASRIRTLITDGRYPEPLEEQGILPESSADLSVGQTFILSGVNYLVTGMSDDTVTLQDVEHPIFSTPMSREILDMLLKNEAGLREITSVVAPGAEPEAEEETAPDEDMEVSDEPSEVPAPVVGDSSEPELEESEAPSEKEHRRERFKERSESLAKRAYQFLEHYAPSFMDGTLDYIRFESDVYEPLYIERLSDNMIAIAHTFTQMGDLMYDPEMVFEVDPNTKELHPLSYEQSDMAIYQRVYSDPGNPATKNTKLERELNSFFKSWSQNLDLQDHVPVRGMKRRDDGDLEYTFDIQGLPVLKKVSAQEVSELVETVSEQAVTNNLYVGDVISFDSDEFRITKISGNSAESVSLRDGSAGVTMDVDQILAQVRGGGTTRLTHFWERKDYQAERQDQKVLADLLNHFEKWRTSRGVYDPGETYQAAMERVSNLRVSENEEDNKRSIRRISSEIFRWFPQNDFLSSRRAETELVLVAAYEYLDFDPHFPYMGNVYRLADWRNGDEERLFNDLNNLLNGPYCVYNAKTGEMPQGVYNSAPERAAQIAAMSSYLASHMPQVPDRSWAEEALYESTLRSAAHYMQDLSALYVAPEGRMEPQALYVGDTYSRDGERWQIFKIADGMVEMYSLETGVVSEPIPFYDVLRSVREDPDAHLERFWEREDYLVRPVQIGEVFELNGDRYEVRNIEGVGTDDSVSVSGADNPNIGGVLSAGYVRSLVDEYARKVSDLSEEQKPLEAPSEQLEASEPVEPPIRVGDYYDDAYGKGVVTQTFPEEFEGRHRAMFTYVDPEAEPGTRAAQGYCMDMEIAAERIQKGEATLIPASQRDKTISEPDKEPSLFDFTYVQDTAAPEKPVPVAVNAVPDAEGRINYKIPVIAENYGGPKARYRNNIAAIRLLKTLEEEDRLANVEEQKILSKYVGWGGLQEAFDPQSAGWAREYHELKDLLTEDEYESARESTLTAFYTPPTVTEAIYTALSNFGFRRGNILDPCCGTGNFFGMLPEHMKDSKLYGVELDSISGRISRQLYQKANILIEGYEKTSLPDSFYDAAVGNVPFGSYKLSDRRYDKENFLIHDYFFAKTLDKVRPGGIVAFITSKGTMDKANDSVRKYIAQRADLLGAIRLPNNTFKENAGTEAVADILFLQKRSRPIVNDPYWVGLGQSYDYATETWGPEINQYFVEHPEMVLGDMVEVSGPHGPEWTCVPREGEDLRSALQEAVSFISASNEVDLTVEEPEEIEERSDVIPADPNVRNFSYTVVDGDIYFREDSQMYKPKLNKKAEQRIKGLVKLRDITRKLIDAQVRDEPDAVVFDLQRQLNEAYDSFTKKFGLINSRGNSNAFSDDSSYFLLCSLEILDDEDNFLGKADMFYKRTIGKHTPVTHTETAREALAVCMGEKGHVDLTFISQLCGLTEEEAVSDLKGLIFPVPGREGEYEISSIYLSGNVRKKLETAREAAKEDPKYAVNAEYLENALPESLEPEDISVRLGATWIPQEDITAFMHELLNFSEQGYISYYKDRIKAAYEPAIDSWQITNKNWDSRPIVNTTYGTARVSAYRLLEDALNQKNTQVFDTVEGSDGKERRVINTEETIAARDKQELIKEKFKEWIWSDPERTARLSKLYNEKFNSIVPPEYDPNMVIFHGMNPYIKLEDHQKESCARILFGGNTLLAHVVGAGKTWTMVAAAMEAKQLGLCNKSLITVPNHLVRQWASAIYELYPSANVLASTKKDFETKNRKKFCSRIATGDYDIVVIGHSQFERIPLSVERQVATLKEQIRDITLSIELLESNYDRSFTVKQMERTKKSLQTKLEKLQEGKKRDDVVTFEELGVDRLFVDESHEFKNLFLYTKMHNVAGISQTDSQKASDLFMKCRYIDELTGNMGNIHATGTPLSNTMAELYTEQRYLQYDLLQEMGLGSFDAWGSTFGETVQSIELAPEGTGYRERTRFAQFFNIPELIAIYKQVADIRTADMLNLPVPEVEYHTNVVPASEEQKAEVQLLAERADAIRQRKVTNKEDNMLCVTNDGRKLALDQRLVNPELPDNPNSKANACVQEIMKYYREGEDKKLTQLVFCDLSTPTGNDFNVYQDLKDKLVAQGIPADEIRFIHEANTDEQKEALFSKVRSGAIRILMGSTGKMGTGTNVQDRLIAGHDLDCPWRPSDLEQRAGRVVRRGNGNDLVHIHRYVTENTFDAYLYQLIEAKQRFASQIFTSRSPVRVAADVDESVLNYCQIKALASGNPKIREKIELEIEISRLKTIENSYKRDQRHLEFLIRNIPLDQKTISDRLAGLEEDYAFISSQPSRTEKGEMHPAEVKGVTYENQAEAGNAIFAAMNKLPERDKWFCIGHLRGMRILAMQAYNKSYVNLSIAGKRNYGVTYGVDGQGLMVRLNNILDNGIQKSIAECKKELARLDRDLASAQAEYGKPSPNAEILKAKRARLSQLERELNLDNLEKAKAVEAADTAAPEVHQHPSLADRITDAQRRSETSQRNTSGRDLNNRILS